jgi:Arc/MetJ-type ribon-helix-helix transcriptional regulator
MGTTERLVLDLPSRLVASLREAVRSGVYPSESAAIEELLVTWYGPEGTEEPPIGLIRSFVAEGVADADAGRVSDAEDVYERVLGRIDTLAASKAK